MTISSFFRQELARRKRSLAFLSCLHLAAGLLTIAGAFCTAQILSCATFGTLRETFTEKAVPLFGVLLFVVLGKWMLDVPERQLRGRLRLDAQERLRRHIHVALFARSPLALSPATGGELLGLACEGVDRLQGIYEKTLPVLLGIAVRMPLFLIALALADPWTGPFLLYLIGRVTKERSTREWHAMMKMGSAFAELLRTIPMLKLFEREQAEAARVEKTSDAFTRAALSVLETAFVSAFALELITTLSIALIAVDWRGDCVCACVFRTVARAGVLCTAGCGRDELSCGHGGSVGAEADAAFHRRSGKRADAGSRTRENW